MKVPTVRETRAVETATQTLHRLTSYTWAWYEPSREDDDLVWSVPVDDPRVVRDFQPTDMDHLPWFYKRYDPALPRVPLPRDLPSTTFVVWALLSICAERNHMSPNISLLNRVRSEFIEMPGLATEHAGSKLSTACVNNKPAPPFLNALNT